MKTVIITGANGNLGVSTVKKFLIEGYKILALDHGNNNLEFALDNPNFQFATINLTDENEVSAFIEKALQKYSKIDAALLLAGGFAMGTIAETASEDLKKMYSLNFETAYFISKPLLKHMLANNYGRTVFIGAKPALKPAEAKNKIAYAFSKSLLFKLAEAINEEGKGKNVVASIIVPSIIDTETNRKSMPDADPSNWVKAAQIADVLEFICSEKGNPLRETVFKIYNNA